MVLEESRVCICGPFYIIITDIGSLWCQVRRRELQAEALQEGSYVHGQRRERYQWIPILHHHLHPSVRHQSSSTQHLLTLSSHLNGKHVVFGEVMEGYEIVEQIENFSKDGRDRPTVEVKIVKSGELPVPEEGIHVEL